MQIIAEYYLIYSQIVFSHLHFCFFRLLPVSLSFRLPGSCLSILIFVHFAYLRSFRPNCIRASALLSRHISTKLGRCKKSNMAQAELDILLNKLSGRLTGDSKFYTTHRHGKTVVSNYPLHRDPKKVTAQQQAQSDAFGKAVKLCKAEMNNPERLAFWQEQYNRYVKLANKSLSRANAQFFGIDPNTTPQSKQKYYSTLRGFIIAQLTHALHRNE